MRAKVYRFAALMLAAWPALACAQWSLIDLHPAATAYSECYAAQPGRQLGRSSVGGQYHASAWSDTAGSWVDLNPANAAYSFGWALAGGRQVGSAYLGDLHAGTWNGTAASWTDLNPTGSTRSEAYGASGNQQVGFASFANATTPASGREPRRRGLT